MGISERKRRETEILRQRVLEVAEKIMAKEGARHVTMRRIATSVEYAPTVLYRLFADKDDLMDHLIARGYDGVRNRYDEVLNRRNLEPLLELQAILDVYVTFALEHPNHYRMWFDTSEIRAGDEKMTMKHGRLDFVVFQPWLDSIDACSAVGLFAGRDRPEVFQVLWSRVHGLISLRLQHPDFPWLPIERHLEEGLGLTSLAHQHTNSH